MTRSPWTWVGLLALIGLLALAYVAFEPGGGGNDRALLEASKAGDLAKVKALVEAGANVNFQSSDPKWKQWTGQEPDPYGGYSALHEAAEWARVDVIEYLLSKGAKIDSRNRWGTTPLMMAVAVGSKEGTVLLLAKGADPKIINDAGKGVLAFANKRMMNPNAQEILDICKAAGATQ